jgi:hypothetical protein
LLHNPPFISKEHIMPRFPTREADIAQLGKRLISGMRENAEDFPASPVGADEIEAYLAAFQEKSDVAASAQGAATKAVDAKGKALQILTEGMRAVLRYAEDAVKYDSGKLQNLGWNGRKTRSELEVPGQASTLEAKREGPAWVLLEWKKPVDGGRVAAYHVQMLRDGEKEWEDVTTCFERMTVLTNQERGVELEYRIVTANKAGRGVPSNEVKVVL